MNSPFSSVSFKREEFESGTSSQLPQRLHLNGGVPPPVHPLLFASSSHHPPCVPAFRPLCGTGGVVSDGTPTRGTFSRPSHLVEAQQRGSVGPPQRPSSGDANTTISQFLMNYVVGTDREFNKKAIDSLIKKLKDKRDELDDFIASVSSMGQQHTKCVTTPRTLDGRLQVAGRKGFPHVVYAKIFRWPDLHKNELKHKSFCMCAFDLKVEQVCVNPYHYERVISVEGIELESNSGSPSHSSEFVPPTIGHSSSMPASKNIPTSPDGTAFSTARGPGRPPNAFRQQKQPVNDNKNSLLSQHQQRMQSVHQWQQQTTQIGGGGDIQNQNPRPVTCTASVMFHTHGIHHQQSHANHQRQSPQENSPHSSVSPQMASVALGGGASSLNQTTRCPPPHSSPQRQQQQQFVHNHRQICTPHHNPQHQTTNITSLPPAQIPVVNSLFSHDIMQHNANAIHQQTDQFYCAPVTSHSQLYPSELDPIPTPFFDTTTTNCKAQMFKYISGVTEFSKAHNRPLISDKPMPLHWCVTNYYEFDLKIGEEFQAATDCPQIFVDGGLDSTDNARFCLGPLTNTDRKDAAEKCRRNIGRGIRLDLKGEGDVWLTVLCQGPVFVQSHYLDVLSEREELGHSHKFVQFTTVKIFDLFKCYECLKIAHLERMMARRVNRETRSRRRVRLDNHHNIRSTAPGASGGGGAENTATSSSANTNCAECSDDETSADGPGADDYRSLCTVRISFFKGFGLSYPKRTIQETPCWFELRLNRALQLLDEVMNTPLIDHLT